MLYFVESTYTLLPPAYMFRVIQDKSPLQSVKCYRMERTLFVFESSWATRGNLTHCLHELGLLCMRCQHCCLTRQRKCFLGKEAEHGLSPHFIAAAVRHNGCVARIIVALLFLQMILVAHSVLLPQTARLCSVLCSGIQRKTLVYGVS